MEKPAELGAAEAARRIAEGTLSPIALVDSCLEHIATRDGDVSAWVQVNEVDARAVACEREAEAARGQVRGPLHGIPVAIKDIIDVAGMTTTCGAGPFAHRLADVDAACVAALRAAGAIVLGKVTTTEFAYFEPSATRNPWKLAHTPGGSSSGSAAALAARMVPLALGTQTVGSVLRPAAFCGIVGFKGSYGAIRVDGVNPLARSLDHVGVFARKVIDARLVWEVLAGIAVTQKAPQRPRIAIAPELLEQASPEVAAQYLAAVERLSGAGAKVREIQLPPSFTMIHDAARAILESEFACSQDELYRAHAADYRPRTRALIEAGLEQKTLVYLKAQQARARFRDDMMQIFGSTGILLTPVAATTAPKGLDFTGDPWFCSPWSSIGVPALSLPTVIGSEGLPHAIQLVAATGADAELLAAAAWCEKILSFESSPFASLS
jgi:Asp-tRNA(Asn)/Glu-tRNA(Gln) amidotransferase A subunit family amidase